MNIAIDIRNVGRGRTGSEVVVVELFRALLARDTGHTYYLLTDTDDPTVHAQIDMIYGVAERPHVHVVSLTGGGRGRWILWHVPRFVRRARIDVFHTEYIVPFAIPRSVRVLTHIHDVSFCEKSIRPFIQPRDLFYLDRLIPRSLRRADSIIAVSQFTVDRIVRFFPRVAHKVVRIDNASGSAFAAEVTPLERARARERYALPERYIFSLGTMQPRKNIPLLIRAFARIADRIPDTHLVLSGKRGHNWDDYIASAIEDPRIRDRVHFTGFIDAADLPAVYAEAHAFAFPSLYEGFGLPLLEAFMMDVPVVASDIPVHREVARDAAYFASPHDIDRYAEALYTVCTSTDVRQQLLMRAQVVRRDYSWERAAQEIQQLIESQQTSSNSTTMPSSQKRPHTKKIVWSLIILVIIILACGLWKLESITNAITSEGSVIGSLAKRLPGADTMLQGEADGRINIALLGMRGEGIPGGGQLTDTIMVVSIITNDDAESEHPYTLSFFSIPRDLLVTLPSGDQGKVNSVFFAGEKFTRGAGLSYVSQTLHEVLGQEIHYAAAINFAGFEDMIDTLGGVTVSLDAPFSEPLQFNETHVCDGDKGGVFSIPTGEYQIKYSKKGKITAKYPLCANANPECGGEFNLPAGEITLSGEQALCYVRSRVTSSDFDRARRQQQVLTELRTQATSLSFLTNPGKIGEMITILGDNVQTNLEPWEVERFLEYYQQIDDAHIVQRVLDDSEQGLLGVPEDEGYGYVLTPRAGDYSAIHQAFDAIE